MVHPVDDNEGWERVPPVLRKAIDDHAVSRRQIEAATGVNYRTMQKLLDGEPVARRDRLSVLAQYFGWPSDAFDRIRRGEAMPATVPSKPRTDAERLSSLERRFDRIEEAVQRLEGRGG